MSAKDYQVGGDHYKSNGIQPIDYIMKNGLGFCEGNIVKYVTRWRSKGGVDDLRKARQYIDFLIEAESGPLAEKTQPPGAWRLPDRDTP